MVYKDHGMIAQLRPLRACLHGRV